MGLTQKSKACYHKGSKNVQYVVPSEGKTMYTVLFCGNAAGEYLPNYVIYKEPASNMFHTWINGGHPKTSYNLTKSGWMEDYVFEAWFKGVFHLSMSEKPKPIGSHLTHTTATLAKEEDVAIILFASIYIQCTSAFRCWSLRPSKKWMVQHTSVVL